MSFKDFNYPLTAEQEEAKAKVIASLKAHPYVKAFLKTYGVSTTLVETHAYTFSTWVKDKERAESVSQEQLKINPKLGEYVDLIFDHETQTLMQVYVQVKQLDVLAQSRQYLQNYRIFSLPASLEDLHFESINVDAENPRYLKGVDQARSLSLNSKGLYFHGDLGVGKTYLAACTANMFARKGASVVFVTTSDLITYIKTTFDMKFEYEKLIYELKHCDVLVLDDLGSEPITQWTRDEILFPVLNARMENRKLTLFTSNYPLADLESVYSTDARGHIDKMRAKRFQDRISALASPFEIVGDNRRNLK